jgi:hypothetical protein
MIPGGNAGHTLLAWHLPGISIVVVHSRRLYSKNLWLDIMSVAITPEKVFAWILPCGILCSS